MDLAILGFIYWKPVTLLFPTQYQTTDLHNMHNLITVSEMQLMQLMLQEKINEYPWSVLA